MSLAQEDINQVETIIHKIIQETPEYKNANVRYELDLRERVIRVEEELKHQRDLIMQSIAMMEKRFEQVDKRFEQVDKRFEQVDKRIEQIDRRIDLLQIEMKERFTQVDKRFDQMHQEFMALHHEIKLQMRWSFGTLIAVGGLIVGIMKLL